MKSIKIKREIVYHGLFWLIYFTLNTLRWGSYFDDYSYSFYSNIVEFSVHIILVYFNLYFLLPRLIPNRYLAYIFMLLTAILVMTFVRIIFTYEFVTTDVYKESQRSNTSIFDFNYILAAYIGQLYVIGFTTAIKVTIDYVKNLKKTKRLEKQNLESELSMLKAQLQPHFFFNTLNNLYSLILDKSDRAEETVVKLSEFMSYIIYEGNKKEVYLLNEIKYIQNYIDLEQLRFGNRVGVDFLLTGSIESYKIPPLLLLQFIENLFKHGTDYDLGKVNLYISIEVIDSWLTFITKNKKSGFKNFTKGSKIENGIGLKNTKRRLGLLFDNNYEFRINENEIDYEIVLKIPLK
ncbi:histidine kinase [Tenacibaculum adriaticum]|uniref:Histidine kinase n=1 Tax=Tenacibaculum adriaticum TaxID=413713 RepID=A0A5S5DUY3_9FLAO|nr:histidine kinase [Tenacibaculum adriaticum]TYP99737.1 histidine kinase [Tenacibaculum adriaticum]